MRLSAIAARCGAYIRRARRRPRRPFYRSVAELPGIPDAAFIAVPNHEAPAVAGALAARGAGGFVCFSSGFGELGTEVGHRLNDELLEQAGDLPFLARTATAS